MSLRIKVIILIVGLVVVSTALLSGALLFRLDGSLRGELASWSQTIEHGLSDKGKTVTLNAALAAAQAAESMDFLFLAGLVSSTVANDEQIVFGMIANQDGRVLVHSNPKKSGTMLTGKEYAAARAGKTAVTRKTKYEKEPVIEAIAPVTVGGFPWGTISFGISLNPLHKAVQGAESGMKKRMKTAVMIVGGGVGGSLIVALLIGLLLARRFSRPLAVMSDTLGKIRSGDLKQVVRVGGCREYITFAMGINELTGTVLERDQSIQGNVEQLRTALKEVEDLSQHKDEFLATISHELRTPLNAVMAIPRSLINDFEQIDVLHCTQCKTSYEMDLALPQAATCPRCKLPLNHQKQFVFNGSARAHRHYLERVGHTARDMRETVSSIVDYGSLMNADSAPKYELFNPRDVLENVRQNMEAVAAEKQINLQFHIAPNAVVLKADRTLVTQTLYNLVGNAIKFTPEKGHVRVDVQNVDRDGGQMMQFLVRDTGVGLTAEQAADVFKPFYQVDGGHTRAFGGTGLGLSIVQRIAKVHKGQVSVASEGPNKGSAFSLELPLAQNESA